MADDTNTIISSGEKEAGVPHSPASPQNETLSILERAEKLNKETKEAEERINSHRKAIEELETRRIMGGQSSAGSIAKTPEQLKEEEAKKLADDIVGAFKRR